MKLSKQVVKLMGNRFEIGIVGDMEDDGLPLIALAIAEIARIERLLTTYHPLSETNLINDQAGKTPVKVSAETFQLIERSLRISKITQGAFDISFGSIDKRLWNFDNGLTTLPSSEEALERVKLINYRNILLDAENSTVFLKEKGMRIGFGGIGKGYAAEKAKDLLKSHGAASGIVNASGDLAVWGLQPDGEPWTIGIIDPNTAGRVFSTMTLSNTAVATSGNYEKFVMINGRKYSHTISPKTGLPVTGIKSATVITANAELADAMTTPLMIMGITAGMHLVNQLDGLEAIMIDDQDQVYYSNNIHFR